MRLKGYDYAWPGVCLVTVVATGRARLFGCIRAARVQLSGAGVIVEEEWRRAALVRPDVRLDAFVVMPDHLHGLVGLLGAGDSPTWQTPTSLPALMRQFKSLTTRRINALRRTPGAAVWQRGYHDRIVPDERALAAMRRYIIDNPWKWRGGP
jgi:REP element-mobilizing transposase RayT